jgi:anti-sigma factor RsiW
MDCKNFSNELELYLDDELPPEQQAALIAHIHSCPECESRFQQDKLFKALLNEKLARFIPEAAFVENVRLGVQGI